jgi:hypothetical protein
MDVLNLFNGNVSISFKDTIQFMIYDMIHNTMIHNTQYDSTTLHHGTTQKSIK